MRPATVIPFPYTTLETVTPAGSIHQFDALYADTPERQRMGLQLVTALDCDAAMIFPRADRMTLKHTVIDLDILFIDMYQLIDRIIEVRALDPSSFHASCPCLAAIELRGGESRRRGITVGTWVRWNRPC